MNPVDEHDQEALPGLPEPLPDTERLLWQGGPLWRELAVRALHVRKVGVYFALLLVWRLSEQVGAGAGAADMALAIAKVTAIGGITIGLLCLFAWLIARSTVYTITSQRIVMRFGVALPMTINLPFSKIASAELRQAPNGSGDIQLNLIRGERIGYVILWPHARPFRFARVRPMLRCVADVEPAARKLAAAMRQATGGNAAPLAATPESSHDIGLAMPAR
jgi:hypothetical protein